MKRLLVVDDEPHMARVLTVTLGREGWRVETATSGEEALVLISRELPDAMLTDINMPGMGGRELCHAIRSAMPNHKFPIFVMTSLTAQTERDWVEALGSIEFLEKPVSPRHIAAQLQRHCPKEAA